MKFKNPLLAVTDLERSVVFYKQVLGLRKIADFGANVTLSGGVCLQTAQSWAGFIEREPGELGWGGKVSELYFEEDDFDAFTEKLSGMDIHYVHPVKEHAWGQRVVRFYDPDGHIVEVSESMESVGFKLFEEGKTIEETVKITQHPQNIVEQWYKRFLGEEDENISVCGSNCAKCPYYKKMCSGCNKSSGKVFHSPQGCAIYSCVQSKNLHDCGKCSSLPCKIWKETRDPSYSDEQFEKSIAERIKTLKTKCISKD